jgi:hypothetical protein
MFLQFFCYALSCCILVNLSILATRTGRSHGIVLGVAAQKVRAADEEAGGQQKTVVARKWSGHMVDCVRYQRTTMGA